MGCSSLNLEAVLVDSCEQICALVLQQVTIVPFDHVSQNHGVEVAHMGFGIWVKDWCRHVAGLDVPLERRQMGWRRQPGFAKLATYLSEHCDPKYPVGGGDLIKPCWEKSYVGVSSESVK